MLWEYSFDMQSSNEHGVVIHFTCGSLLIMAAASHPAAGNDVPVAYHCHRKTQALPTMV